MKNKRGMTLIEIITILAVLGIAIPSVLAAFASIVAKAADANTVTVSTNLADEKMEEIIKNKQFSYITSSGPTDFTGSFSEYNHQTVVDYVESADLDTPAGGATDFKRVQIIITKDGLTGFNVTLTTVLANLGY